MNEGGNRYNGFDACNIHNNLSIWNYGFPQGKCTFITSEDEPMHAENFRLLTMICKSKKNEDHVVGWCSDTEAMIGMCSLA